MTAVRPRRSSDGSALVPGGELGEHTPHAGGHGVNADRRTRDAPDVAADLQRVRGGLAPELLAPGLVGHLAAVGFAVHQNVHVLEAVRGVDRHEEGDGPVLSDDAPTWAKPSSESPAE